VSDVRDIVLRNVTKIFGPTPVRALEQLRAGATKEALLAQTGHTVGVRDVSFSIEAGSCFVVMGLSGSGKSTLLRHLNRLIEPTAGEILFEDEDILRLPPEALRRFRRDRTSMVFQRFALFPHKTVLENAAYGLNLQARGGAERRANLQKAQRWIERVGLAGYEAQYPNQLSGGMQQRVGLARALATEAEVMLMDEAFSALDPLIRREMQDALMRLQAELRWAGRWRVALRGDATGIPGTYEAGRWQTVRSFEVHGAGAYDALRIPGGGRENPGNPGRNGRPRAHRRLWNSPATRHE